MKEHNFEDLSNLSMLDLFRIEAESQTGILTTSLLEIEKSPASPGQLETLMRAAHSLKGAARIVNLQSLTKLAHAMEDCFVAAQRGKIVLRQPEIDVLLKAVDLLSNAAKRGDSANQSEPEALRDLIANGSARRKGRQQSGRTGFSSPRRKT